MLVRRERQIFAPLQRDLVAKLHQFRVKRARQAEAARAVKGDSFVQDLVNLFDGRVVDSTIREKQR